MGNKKKIGKSRRDRFYQLAKETGYRARSAFKLIQLNRKYEFLQSSRVVIDLCAAPGGWLQVVAENSPISSIIVGVDLVHIRPIRNVKTLIDDITTDKCRQDLKKELQTWKADCVLHDGAPNVGKNWLHDAFQQSQLTLHALKLATEFLKKGGWFITKVFRSKDYNSLLWVFQQLFKDVHATKPQASRNESAEIFVVCQHFLAPDRIDPKFLDAKCVFKEVESDPKPSLNLLHPEKQTRQRSGYPEGDYTLYHKLNVSEFLQNENYLQLLAEASEVVLDDKAIENHSSTTKEIKECLKDIKVLGKKEIRLIINWRKKLKQELTPDDKKVVDAIEEAAVESDSDDDAKMAAMLAELEGEEKRAMKRKIKKVRREKSKLQHKMDLKMVLQNDPLEISDDKGLFYLNNIKTKKQLEEVEAGDSQLLDDIPDDDNEEVAVNRKNKISFDRGTKDYLDPNELSDEEDSNDDEDDAEPSDMSFEDDNPLLVGRPGKKSKMDMWFSKDAFADLENDEDEDVEIEKMVEVYKNKGGKVQGEVDSMIIPEEKFSEHGIGENVEVRDSGNASGDVDSGSESDSDSDSDSDYDTNQLVTTSKDDGQKVASQEMKTAKKEGFEVVAKDNPETVRLTAKGLAIGAVMISSRKRKRDVIESGYHRYMFADEDLPTWFVKDEAKHHRVELPVTKGDIEEYKMKMKAVDANPIKKVAEAKARKKRKMMKKLDRARKKADTINEVEDVTDREKWQQIKHVYKKAGLLSSKKKEITYVVAKKGTGKRVRRPQGVQGPFRVVDSRMKKDNRTKKNAQKESFKKGKGKRKK